MLREIYIDNYRCFSDFRLPLDAFQLFLGDNGSGKSTVFDAIRKVQRVLSRELVTDVFETESLCRLCDSDIQTIGLTVETGSDNYKYTIKIQHDRNKQQSRIKSEELLLNDDRVYWADGEKTQRYDFEKKTLVDLDHINNQDVSFLGLNNDIRLQRFRDSIQSVIILRLNPDAIADIAKTESQFYQINGGNFAEWFRHHIQSMPNLYNETLDELSMILPGIKMLSLEPAGHSKILKTVFKHIEKSVSIDFRELSSGQKQLIVLYFTLFYIKNTKNSMLFIDEPDNYISLREIMPWLNHAESICNDGDQQIIIISHHPEIINSMARGNEVFFTRAESGQIIVKSYPAVGHLTPAETMARGWDDE